MPNQNDQPDPLIVTERVVLYLLDVGAAQASDSVRVRCGVEIPAGYPFKTGGYPGLPARALKRYPEMVRHRCDNGRSLGVREEFADTEVAHLFEHILIEEYVRAGVDRRAIAGSTLWNFQATGWGRYTVRIDGVPAVIDHVEVARNAARSVGALLVV